jgi:hypothetical protein
MGGGLIPRGGERIVAYVPRRIPTLSEGNRVKFGGYAGVAGADLSNAPVGPVPFTSPFGIPVTRVRTWYAGGSVPGASDGVPGTPVQEASGNPSVSTDPVYQEKSPYGGSQGSGIGQFGVPRPLQQMQESAVGAPGNAPVGYSNDKLITYDRHAMFKVGYENSGRNSGETDPPMDGPARPSMYILNRTVNYQQGTDETAATDDLSRDYSRNAQGMYVAEQGSGWSSVYGGTPGLYQEYGSYQGIAPDTPGYDPVTGTTQGIVAPVNQGMPGDGPQKVWSGPPHGLHSPTLPDYTQTLGRYMAIPQMARPRLDRPSNSPIAGQSYSQTVMPQGQTGTFAQNLNTGSGVAWNQRASGNGWRGRGVL